MTSDSSRLENLLAKIDDANNADPNIEVDQQGISQPKERLYGQRMSHILKAFKPDASEFLTIAARGQHIERWKSPRGDYPDGRTGYKKWRAELSLMHANRVADLMKANGYDENEATRVKYLIQKRQLKTNEETQALEDVVCIVFLTYYLEAFAKKHSEHKLIDIIQKTWKKMSTQGHQAALKIPFSIEMQTLIKKAIPQPKS